MYYVLAFAKMFFFLLTIDDLLITLPHKAKILTFLRFVLLYEHFYAIKMYNLCKNPFVYNQTSLSVTLQRGRVSQTKS